LPPRRNDPCPCGSGLRYKACHGRLAPDADTRLDEAQRLHQRGRLDEAEAAYARILADTPEEPLARHFLGVIHWQRGRLAQAEPLLRASIAARPDLAPFRNNLALLLRDQGRHGAAIGELRAALAIDPAYAEARANLGDTMLRLRDYTGALRELEEGAAQPGALAETFYTLALALERTDRHAEALGALRRAAERLPPDVRAAREELARLSAEKLALEEGLAARDPSIAPARADLGARIRALREALAAHPLFAKVAYRAGQTALRVGQLAEGWQGYHWRPARLAFERQAKAPGTFETPALPSRIEGLRILVEQEQGLGDTLFFLRFARALRDAGARVAFRGDPRLLPMLERTRLFEACIPPDEEPAQPPDFVLAAGDLPLGPPGAGTPAALALAPLPERLGKAREALSGLERPCGVTWRAGTRSDDPYGILFKEVDAPTLARAIPAHATVVSVQRQPAPGEREALERALGQDVRDLSRFNEDLEDALALMAVLDTYVGVSNTNVHFRAGVGLAARVLVPFPPEWRWGARGDESPWFPGFRLARQGWEGAWPS
jgi:tetratricopeptide (TPR) repeat protein